VTVEEIKQWIKANQKGLIVGFVAGLLARGLLR
jgi:predicted negative regulator of RcsB-dependent stress response